MDINKIYANVRLVFPEATTIEINKYILTALDEVNARGIETIRQYEVKYPASGVETGTPSERKDGQDFNYYPDLKCLVLPPEVSLLERVSYKNSQVIRLGSYDYLKSTLGIPAYYITHTGEMYFSMSLYDGDVITIEGSFGGMTIDVLPDKYLPYITDSVIVGLSSQEYQNPDIYAIYLKKLDRSRLHTYESTVQSVNIKRNGRLY